MTRQFFCLSFICLAFISSCFAQQGKNSIEYYNALTYSKTNFTNLPFSIFTNDWFSQLYDTQKPTKGMSGFYFGLSYRRQIGEKTSVGVGVNYSENGQKSTFFYKINGVSEQDLNSIPDYGGTAYSIKYKSYESPLFIEYFLKDNLRFRYFVIVGGAINVYYRVEAENYLLSKSTGSIDAGCCLDVYFHANGGTVKELKKHLEFGLWRMGFLIGVGIEYKAFPLLSVRAKPMLRVYSNLHDTNVANTVAQGSLFNLGCDISFNLNF